MEHPEESMERQFEKKKKKRAGFVCLSGVELLVWGVATR